MFEPDEDTLELLAAHLAVLQIVQCSVERDQVDVYLLDLPTHVLNLPLHPLQLTSPVIKSLRHVLVT